MEWDNSVIFIDSISPHSVRLLVRCEVNSEKLKKFTQLIENITTQELLSDYTLCKAKLDDIYIDIIKFKRQS